MDNPQLETVLRVVRLHADAGRLTECLTRRNWPVAQEQDNAAYSKARRQPGEELLVNLDGHVALRPKMEGAGRQTMVLDR